MKRFSIIAAAALMMLAGCSQYKYETVKGDPLNTKIYTLDNGLKVYMSVNKEKPRIQTYIAVRVGGKNDPSETTGLAHYFEHLMFKGTEQYGTGDYTAEKPMLDEIEQLFEVYRKTTDEKERAAIYHRIDSVSYEASKLAIPNEYDKLMALIGADGTNAFTSKDMTVYVEDIPSNQIDNWAKIEADRFMHPVLRGFHTELETIYEEKNMSLTQDNRKVFESIDNALFPHHPYGQQTVLGSQDHLKNPSITNVKKYHDEWYVPNNMAICVAGDFDPDEMVATIEKYFGQMKPNPELPVLTFEQEPEITEPIVRDVYGIDAESLLIGWRLPEAVNKDNDIAYIASDILYNGMAGLIDLDVNQQQKMLIGYAYASCDPDYGKFVASGRPKAGQTLEEAKDILLAEVAKLRNGDFDESLLEGVINNNRKDKMQELEDNSSIAMTYVESFINKGDWKDDALVLDRLAKITKEDVVKWANKYLGENSYAVIYKRIGEDKDIKKISAPKITPIESNRDNQSDFLKEIQNTTVKPIEPVFVNFEKEMSVFDAKKGVEVLYKKNEQNSLFNMTYVINRGANNDPKIPMAFEYLGYLGTNDKSYEEIASELYNLAGSYSFQSGSSRSYVSFEGLEDSRDQIMAIVEDLVANAKPDDQILDGIKSDIIKSRADKKLNQRSCFSALQRYIIFGGEFVKKCALTNEEVMAVTSEELLAIVKDIFSVEHEVEYYGPADKNDVKKSLLAIHHTADELTPCPVEFTKPQLTAENKVVLAQYDAKQLYYIQYSADNRTYNPILQPQISLYDEYFGGGMNSIVFQEMREARGLAYSAWASLVTPYFKDGYYYYMAFIATQNDKMKTAVEAFDDIINNMPESEAAFSIAKESLIARLRTQRKTGAEVLYDYIECRDLGLKEPTDKAMFETVQNLTLEDVKATQAEWVKNRNYSYGILGDIKDLDVDYLKTLGNVEVVSLSDIFGY